MSQQLSRFSNDKTIASSLTYMCEVAGCFLSLSRRIRDRKKYIGSRIASLSPPCCFSQNTLLYPLCASLNDSTRISISKARKKLTDLEMRFTADETFR